MRYRRLDSMQETPGVGGGAPDPIALPSRSEGLALYGLFIGIVLMGTTCLATSLLLPVATTLAFGAIAVFLLCGNRSTPSPSLQPSTNIATTPADGAAWGIDSASNGAPHYRVAPVQPGGYDPNSIETAMRIDTTDSIARALSRCAATWCLTDSRSTFDTRRNAGASTVVERAPSTCRRGVKGPFPSNFDPWAIEAVPRLLLLFPDFLGVLQSGALTRVPYADITVAHRTTRFVEDGPVPPDATVLEMTWRFVCQDGSADLRFADNRQVPVLAYGEVELSTGGQSITLQTSFADAARVVAELFVRLGARAATPVASIVQPTPTAPPATENPFGPMLVLPPISDLESDSTSPPPRAPTAPPSAANVSHTQSSVAASITWRDLAMVLKRVALADRRFSRDELDAITDIVRVWDPSAGADPAVLRDAIEAMRCDEAAFDAAIARCAGADADARARLYARCQDVARADGRVTPKETERLAAIARALEVEG